LPGRPNADKSAVEQRPLNSLPDLSAEPPAGDHYARRSFVGGWVAIGWVARIVSAHLTGPGWRVEWDEEGDMVASPWPCGLGEEPVSMAVAYTGKEI